MKKKKLIQNSVLTSFNLDIEKAKHSDNSVIFVNIYTQLTYRKNSRVCSVARVYYSLFIQYNKNYIHKRCEDDYNITTRDPNKSTVRNHCGKVFFSKIEKKKNFAKKKVLDDNNNKNK